MLGLFLISSVFAQVPVFVPGKAVYLVPSDLEFPTQKVNKATSNVEYPVYVVVYERVKDGRIEPGHESETEDAIELVWSTWRTKAGMAESAVSGDFDGTEGSLVLLALDDREVRMISGSRWDTALNLHSEALLSLIDDYFLPMAQVGDFDQGLADLVVGLDQKVVKGLELKAQQIEQKRIAEEKAAKRKEKFNESLVWSVPLTTFGGIFLLLLLIRMATLGARLQLFDSIKSMKEKLAKAEEGFADFRINIELRDQLVRLKTKGPKTKELLTNVFRQLDEIQAGLISLKSHVEKYENSKVAYFGWKKWRELKLELEGEFEIRADSVPERLFSDADDYSIKKSPTQFMDDLEQKYQEAHQNWTRLLDAVKASLREAEQDIPDEDLKAALEELRDLKISEKWLMGHPLMPDPSAVWTALDLVRREDPVEYLDMLNQALETENQIFVKLETFISEYKSLKEPDLPLKLNTSCPQSEDPKLAYRQARDLLTLLYKMINEGGVFEEFSDLVLKYHELFKTVSDKNQALKYAVENAESTIEIAKANLEKLEKQLENSKQEILSISAFHISGTVSPAFVELAEAVEDFRQGQGALTQALTYLKQDRHLESLNKSNEALNEHKESLQDLFELTQVLTKLEQNRTEALELFQILDKKRETMSETIGTYGSYYSELDEGDILYKDLRNSWQNVADWEKQLERTKIVLSSWQSGVRKAREYYQAEQARIAAELERQRQEEERRHREAREAEAARRRASSRSSSYSSSRSYSSSSRSSGRSYSSSSRSAGRKF